MEAVKLLLSSEGVAASVGALDAAGHSPLTISAASGHTAVCSLLLRGRAEVNQLGPTGATALHFAVRATHMETTRLLLRTNANARSVDSKGTTALDIALGKREEDMAAALIEAGAARGVVAQTVAQLVGASEGDAPLMFALKLLLLSDVDNEPEQARASRVECANAFARASVSGGAAHGGARGRTQPRAQPRREASISEETRGMNHSLLALTAKSVLTARGRALLLLLPPTDQRHYPGAEERSPAVVALAELQAEKAGEASQQCAMDCEWVAEAATASVALGGPERWRDALAAEDQPIVWWQLLDRVLHLLDLPSSMLADAEEGGAGSLYGEVTGVVEGEGGIGGGYESGGGEDRDGGGGKEVGVEADGVSSEGATSLVGGIGNGSGGGGEGD